jgi:hypothetical protein
MAARLATEHAAPHRAAATASLRVPGGGHMSLLFRNKSWLTVGQLVPAWASELGNKTEEWHILDYLFEDIVNGRLDFFGPRANQQRCGLALLDAEDRPIFVQGDLLAKVKYPFARNLHRLLVAREAVLQFARGHRLPPPSWWSHTTIASKKQKTAGRRKRKPDAWASGKLKPVGSRCSAGSRRGRKPKADWDGTVRAFVFNLLDYNGWPEASDPKWSSQADVEREVMTRVEKECGSISESTVREHTNRLMHEWWQKRGK